METETNDLIKALVAQGRTREEAESEYTELKAILYDYIDAGDTVGACEVLSTVGLEPDYLLNLL